MPTFTLHRRTGAVSPAAPIKKQQPASRTPSSRSASALSDVANQRASPSKPSSPSLARAKKAASASPASAGSSPSSRITLSPTPSPPTTRSKTRTPAPASPPKPTKPPASSSSKSTLLSALPKFKPKSRAPASTPSKSPLKRPHENSDTEADIAKPPSGRAGRAGAAGSASASRAKSPRAPAKTFKSRTQRAKADAAPAPGGSDFGPFLATPSNAAPPSSIPRRAAGTPAAGGAGATLRSTPSMRTISEDKVVAGRTPGSRSASGESATSKDAGRRTPSAAAKATTTPGTTDSPKTAPVRRGGTTTRRPPASPSPTKILPSSLSSSLRARTLSTLASRTLATATPPTRAPAAASAAPADSSPETFHTPQTSIKPFPLRADLPSSTSVSTPSALRVPSGLQRKSSVDGLLARSLARSPRATDLLDPTAVALDLVSEAPSSPPESVCSDKRTRTPASDRFFTPFVSRLLDSPAAGLSPQTPHGMHISPADKGSLLSWRAVLAQTGASPGSSRLGPGLLTDEDVLKEIGREMMEQGGSWTPLRKELGTRGEEETEQDEVEELEETLHAHAFPTLSPSPSPPTAATPLVLPPPSPSPLPSTATPTFHLSRPSSDALAQRIAALEAQLLAFAHSASSELAEAQAAHAADLLEADTAHAATLSSLTSSHTAALASLEAQLADLQASAAAQQASLSAAHARIAELEAALGASEARARVLEGMERERDQAFKARVQDSARAAHEAWEAAARRARAESDALQAERAVLGLMEGVVNMLGVGAAIQVGMVDA